MRHGVCFVLKSLNFYLPNLNLHLIQTVNVKYVQWVLENFCHLHPIHLNLLDCKVQNRYEVLSHAKTLKNVNI